MFLLQRIYPQCPTIEYTDADGNIIFNSLMKSAKQWSEQQDLDWLFEILMWCWAWLSWYFGCDCFLAKMPEVWFQIPKWILRIRCAFLKIEICEGTSLQMFLCGAQIMFGTYIYHMPRYLGSAIAEALIWLCGFWLVFLAGRWICNIPAPVIQPSKLLLIFSFWQFCLLLGPSLSLANDWTLYA